MCFDFWDVRLSVYFCLDGFLEEKRLEVCVFVDVIVMRFGLLLVKGNKSINIDSSYWVGYIFYLLDLVVNYFWGFV